MADKHRYTLGRELGRGAQSVVCLAFDAAVGREVAFKMVHDASGDGAFVREARITGQLEHPGIVPVYEIGRDERGQHYCTQKLVRGRSLREALTECTNATERLALLPHLVDVCNAVAYAHSRGVIHRDLKPENVMVGEFGETVVLDWGIAKVLGGTEQVVERPLLAPSPTQTQQGALMGTPLYLSPEQAAGNPSAVDRRSDVWSLGVMLYELVSGQWPFVAPNVVALLEKVRSGAYQPLGGAAPGVAPELAAIVHTALTVDPNARFADAGALAKELSAFRAGGRLSVYQYSSWELVRRFIARNKTLTAVVASAVLAVGMAGVVAFQNYNRAEASLVEARHRLASERLARARQAEAQLDWNGALALYRAALEAEESAQARWGIGLLSAYEASTDSLQVLDAGVTRASFSADGRRLLTLSERGLTLFDSTGATTGTWPGDSHGALDATGEHVLLLGESTEVVRVADRHRVVLEGPRGVSGAFSPGQPLVAVSRRTGALELFDSVSGVARGALPEPVEPCVALRFSDSGKFLACAGMRGGVAVWEVEAKRRTNVFKVPTRSPGLLFDRDRRLLVGDSNRFIHVFALEGDAPPTILTGQDRSIFALAWSPAHHLFASASTNQTVMIWSADTLSPLIRLPSPLVSALRFSTDTSLELALAEGSRVSTRLAGLPLMIAAGAQGDVPQEAAFSPDERGLFWCTPTRVGLTVLATGETVTRDEGCRAVRPSPDGRQVAVAGFAGGLRVVDATTLADVSVLDAGIRAGDVTWLKDGALRATSRETTTAWTWNPASGAVSDFARAPDEEHTAWLSNGQVSLATNGAARVLDVQRALAFRFSPDGTRLAVGTFSGAVHLFDTDTGARRCSTASQTALVTDVSFSANGRVVTSSSVDLSVWLFNPDTCEALGRVPGVHHEAVLARWSPSGKHLVVGDTMGVLTVFRVSAP